MCLCLFPLSMLEHYQVRPYACCHSLCAFICVSVLMCLKVLILLMFYISSTTCNLYAFSSTEKNGSLSSGGGNLCRHLFRIECSKSSHSLHIISENNGSLYLFPSTIGVSFSVEKILSKTMTYEYSKMTLGIILLLHSFSIILLFGFLLSPWPIVLRYWSSDGDEFHLMQ